MSQTEQEKKAQSERDKAMGAFADRDVRIRPVRNGFIMKTNQGEFVYKELSELLGDLQKRLLEK